MELESPSSKKVKRESSPPPLQLPSGYFDQKEKKNTSNRTKRNKLFSFRPHKANFKSTFKCFGKKNEKLSKYFVRKK